MSLFGSSPPAESDAAASKDKTDPRSSLFADEAPTTRSSGGLFNDDAGNGDSPWTMPVKRQSRADLVKTLLPSTDVPESYVDAYDVLGASEHRSDAGKIDALGVKNVLKQSRLTASQQETILRLITGEQDNASIGRNEFNVLLALIGLAQESEEISLDSVDERRNNLPEPTIIYIDQLRKTKAAANTQQTPPLNTPDTNKKDQKDSGSSSSPVKSRRLRKDSLEGLDSDPWASPAASKTHTNAVHNEATPAGDLTTAAKPTRALHEPQRTTSVFTTNSINTIRDESVLRPHLNGADGGPSWDTYGTGNSGNAAEIDSAALTGGFGSTGAEIRPQRALGGGRVISHGVGERVTVTLLPDKEGLFMFQHHNYEVKSQRRGSAVVRRYSDFVWLLDCLHKRYPFRQLPLLPPKRVAVNGRHLSSDISFMEKRRRGLIRFVNALVQHPTLNQEQLVIMFLTVPTVQELAVWRKQATISVQEEFMGKSLLPDLEDSLPKNLAETFEVVRRGVRESAEHYIGLCNLLERLVKRNQGVAADCFRFSQALSSLTEASSSTYATDTNDVPLLNEGIMSTAKHLSTNQTLLEDEARAWDEGVLEDFKRQRDTLVSVRDMFERRDRYAKDTIPQLERRIENNEHKLASMMAGAGGKPGEQEKLETAVQNDKQSIVDQHARGVFIKECIRDELLFFQQSQYHVSRTLQDWSQERVKYIELQADNWRRLAEQVEHMPLGD